MELKDLEIKKQELLAELKGVEEQIKEKSLIQLSDVPDGEEFSWCGYSWVKLGSEQDGVLCIASKIVHDMKFSKDNDADYKKSDIKKYLEGTFLKELNQDDMLDYLMDLMSYQKVIRLHQTVFQKSCLIWIFWTVRHLARLFQWRAKEKKVGVRKRSLEKGKPNRHWTI